MQIKGPFINLFSLNFASIKFRDFRDFEKIAKFNTPDIYTGHAKIKIAKFNTV